MDVWQERLDQTTCAASAFRRDACRQRHNHASITIGLDPEWR